jgi:hypothetical protein
MKKHTLILCFLLGFNLASTAQPSLERSVVASAGGSWYDGSGFELDYTIGEVAVLTISDATNYLTQGFQQPFSNHIVFIDQSATQDLNIFVYPNPATDHFNIRIENATGLEINCQITDILGQLIMQRNGIEGNDKSVLVNFDISLLATGNYFIRVCSGKRLLKTARLIKINQ